MTWEERIVPNANFQDYRIFYNNDAPPTRPILVESIDQDGPYGAKGLWEVAQIPIPAAIANAVYVGSGDFHLNNEGNKS